MFENMTPAQQAILEKARRLYGDAEVATMVAAFLETMMLMELRSAELLAHEPAESIAYDAGMRMPRNKWGLISNLFRKWGIVTLMDVLTLSDKRLQALLLDRKRFEDAEKIIKAIDDTLRDYGLQRVQG